MAKFRLTVFMVLALILSLSMATAVAAAPPSSSSDTELRDFTVELCGEAVCLEWTPSDAAYDFEEVVVWKGSGASKTLCGSGAVDYAGERRIPFSILKLCPGPSAGVGEVQTFSFKVWALRDHPDYYHRWIGVARTQVVAIEVPGFNPPALDVSTTPVGHD